MFGCVVFDSTRNVFAIVRGNGSAPTANRLADWLGELKPLADHPNAKFEAIPMTTEADLTAVNEAHGARKIDFTIPVEDLKGLGVSLSADLRKAVDIAPGAKVRISPSYGNRRPPAGVGDALLDLVRGIAGNLGGATRAKAGVYREVESKRRKKKGATTRMDPETVDLLQHNLARELKVTEVGGNPSIASTLVAMGTTMLKMGSQIVQVWERGGNGIGQAAEGVD